MNNVPQEAEIIERIQESPTIFTWRLQLTNPELHQRYAFRPGQFNMVYLYGVGEVAISIVSDPEEKKFFDQTIRTVGRITKAMANLQQGDRVGIRGPFGRGWPMHEIQKKDVVILTGGLGCAPTVSVINYIMERRKLYGKVKILQGIKHSDDFIFRERFAKWKNIPDTEVFVAADQINKSWPWYKGYVTDMIQPLQFHAEKTVVLMCGPEAMMSTAIKLFVEKKIAEQNIFLSMERNMECAIGHCGHCQYGGLFICKNGPIFPYSEIKNLFQVPGF